MSCAGCVGRAEKALAGTSGVTSSQVNLASESATITGTATSQALVQALNGRFITPAIVDYWCIPDGYCIAVTRIFSSHFIDGQLRAGISTHA